MRLLPSAVVCVVGLFGAGLRQAPADHIADGSERGEGPCPVGPEVLNKQRSDKNRRHRQRPDDKLTRLGERLCFCTCSTPYWASRRGCSSYDPTPRNVAERFPSAGNDSMSIPTAPRETPPRVCGGVVLCLGMY